MLAQLEMRARQEELDRESLRLGILVPARQGHTIVEIMTPGGAFREQERRAALLAERRKALEDQRKEVHIFLPPPAPRTFPPNSSLPFSNLFSL
jgi:hypothetical protein